MVIKELATIAFADMAVYASWGPHGLVLKASDELPEAATRAVAEIAESATEGGRNTKFKLYDKIRALELLAKHLGMLVERSKVEVEGDMTFTVVFDGGDGRIVDAANWRVQAVQELTDGTDEIEEATPVLELGRRPHDDPR